MGDPQSLENIVLSCNKLAMDHLRQQNFKSALHLLKRAEDLLKTPEQTPGLSKLLAVTLNNLGCYYKKTGMNSKSLQYLSEALKLQARLPSEKVNLAGTHLNVCAIRSQMKQHQVALKHALQAVQLLSEVEQIELSLNVKSTLVIAFHNAGIESELLGSFDKAEQFYTVALGKAEEALGHHHEITQAVIQSYNALTSTEKNRKFQFQKMNARAPSARSVSSQNRKPNLESALPKIRTAKAKKQKNLHRSVDIENPPVYRPPVLERSVQSARKKSAFQPTPPISKPPIRSKVHNRMQSAGSRNNLARIEDKLENLHQQLSQFEQKLMDSREFGSSGGFQRNEQRRRSVKTPKTQPGMRHTLEYQKQDQWTNQHQGEFTPKISGYRKFQTEFSEWNFSENIFQQKLQGDFFDEKPLNTSGKKITGQKTFQEALSGFTPQVRSIQSFSSPNKQKIGLEDFQNFTPEKLSTKPPSRNFKPPVDYLKQKNLAAIFIQKFVRGFLCKRRLPELKRQIADEKAQIAIKELEELQKMNQTELKVFQPKQNPPPSFPKPKPRKPQSRPPSRFKYKSLQPIPEAKIQLQEGNIAAIQALIRGFIQKKRYQRIKKAAVKIQSLARMHSVKNLYQDIYAAIVFIQENWRLYRRRRRGGLNTH